MRRCGALKRNLRQPGAIIIRKSYKLVTGREAVASIRILCGENVKMITKAIQRRFNTTEYEKKGYQCVNYYYLQFSLFISTGYTAYLFLKTVHNISML